MRLLIMNPNHNCVRLIINYSVCDISGIMYTDIGTTMMEIKKVIAKLTAEENCQFVRNHSVPENDAFPTVNKGGKKKEFTTPMASLQHPPGWCFLYILDFVLSEQNK